MHKFLHPVYFNTVLWQNRILRKRPVFAQWVTYVRLSLDINIDSIFYMHGVYTLPTV